MALSLYCERRSTEPYKSLLRETWERFTGDSMILTELAIRRGVQGPASTDPPAWNRPNQRSTGGSESTYGRSRIGKKTTRIVWFGSGFQNISPGKPEPTELFIIKKKKVDLTFQWFSLSLPKQPMPCPARDSKLTPSQHEHQPFITK